MSVKKKPGSEIVQFSDELKEKIRLGIVVSEWNEKITGSLLEACKDCFKKHGFKEDQIIVHWVPGSFELAYGAQLLFEYSNVDAVACLGCIIKGETPHFHYISESTALTIGQLSLKYNRPVSFGVITSETEFHASDRAGGSKGNKGEEAAMAVLKMLKMKEELKSDNRKSLGFV
ncbi:MAG TPA: 6,7-dimethyl-8-ribityllumazine synthase [Bacteroidia bacterium]|nr:6,7-dimethyl-8-ribityllumazine synthase [Bacteroidia bacterium]HRS58161.1 6,7-dimethyl-8-ribityllumazine synthase [Bacteroidia bacterium]HRU67491.1 6,7-dimethyl-8-ribityllumazine synthase [Bacteroidia bacterium]